MCENIGIRDLILRRKSTRTFSGNKLTQHEVTQINNYIRNETYQKGIYGYVTFELVENKNNTVFGEYGEINGSTYYLAAIIKDDYKSLIDVGFAFERFMLFAESIDLGTCWLAATSFDRNEAELSLWLNPKEIIAAISPIGEKAKIKSNNEIEIIKELESDDRLDFDMLFFDSKKSGKIENNKTRQILEMVRVAPSALNNQPWRVIMDGETAHFYIKRGFKTVLNYDVQMMDIGVALYHYVLASGRHDFFYLNPGFNYDYEYIMSVK